MLALFVEECAARCTECAARGGGCDMRSHQETCSFLDGTNTRIVSTVDDAYDA